jgi:integrase
MAESTLQQTHKRQGRLSKMAASPLQQTHNKVALTHRSVEVLPAAEHAYRVPDARRPGLAVRVAPSGIKTWDLAFRIRGTTKTRRLSLGQFPAIGLEAARERATLLANAAKTGRDLVAEERQEKVKAESRVTVEQLMEMYLARVVRGKLRTAVEVEVRLKRVLAPLKNRYADEIRRRDLRVLFDAAAQRGVLREAEKQRQLVGTVFRWALSQDIVEIDSSAGLTSYGSSPRRDRVLSSEEIRLFFNWLETCGIPPDYGDALKLQLSIGARIGEVGGMRAEEVNRESWIWILPAERSKNARPRTTPLLGLAREIVERHLPPTNQGPLFRTEKGQALTSNCVGSVMVKRRKSIPIEHFTSHDLRRTVATGLIDLGFPAEVVAAVLGHEAGGKDVRTLMRHYVRSEQIEAKRRALAAWDGVLRQAIMGEKSLSNVTLLSATNR